MREVVASFANGISPQWPATESSAFMETVKLQSLWFASWKPVPEDDKRDVVGEELRGSVAVKACYAYVKQKFDTGADEELSLHDLELLHMHSWSLGPAASATLRAYTDTLVARLGAACSGAITGSTTPFAKRSRISKKEGPTTRARDDSAADDAEHTMQFFAWHRAKLDAAR